MSPHHPHHHYRHESGGFWLLLLLVTLCGNWVVFALALLALLLLRACA